MVPESTLSDLMLRLPIQQRLERGVSRSRSLWLMSRAWGGLARVERSLSSRVPVLCVGGSTLGGSGRTPLSIACARSLARTCRVVVVGHGYGARPPAEPCFVDPTDDVQRVGDEALECAVALAPHAVRVVVARDRQRALDAAAPHADVIILDGPLQLTPHRARLSLLAVHATMPWGSAACPPLGDLRAPRAALERVSDRVVTVGPHGDVTWRSYGVRLDAKLVSWAAIRGRFPRMGLATGIARPERVEALLQEHGVVPQRNVRVANHAPLEVENDASVDLWLITGKDAHRTKPSTHAPVAIIDYHLDLPPFLEELLTSRFSVRF